MRNLKDNPWKDINIMDYEEHMGHTNVGQLQLINNIMVEQIRTISPSALRNSCVAVLGITNGNGLGYEEFKSCGEIIGIDINQSYLDACRERFGRSHKLSLYCMDLIFDKEKAADILENADLIIADLIIEHIHSDNFIALLKALKPKHRIVSCVIQHNNDGGLVSVSGKEHVFDILLPLIREIEEHEIIDNMNRAGYSEALRKIYELPNKKQFIRIDFNNKEQKHAD